jgi:hypothetical protein
VAAGAPRATAAGGSAPSTAVVYFHPDGTTSSALALLAGEFDLYVEVRLRGLTGGTTIGEVYVGDETSAGIDHSTEPAAGGTP